MKNSLRYQSIIKMNVVIALDEKDGFSKNGDIPWFNLYSEANPIVKKDLYFFKEITKGSTLVMGVNTWNSAKTSFPGRNCFIISSGKTPIKSKNGSKPIVIKSLKEFSPVNVDPVFLIGGLGLIQEALKFQIVKTLYISRIPGDWDCDQFFDMTLLNNFVPEDHSDSVRCFRRF